VHGKLFCCHRSRRRDAIDPTTGERLNDVLMFRVADLGVKELMLAVPIRIPAGFWLDVMDNPDAKMSERLEASRLLADRGWGRSVDFKPVEEEDPLGLEEARERLLAKLAPVAELARRPREG
jgi:hypothetical protein